MTIYEHRAGVAELDRSQQQARSVFCMGCGFESRRCSVTRPSPPPGASAIRWYIDYGYKIYDEIHDGSWQKIDMIKSTRLQMPMIIIMRTLCVPYITPLSPTIINIPFCKIPIRLSTVPYLPPAMPITRLPSRVPDRSVAC